MGTASHIIRIAALGACFLTHLQVTGDHMSGVRRALRTIDGIAAHEIARTRPVEASDGIVPFRPTLRTI